MLTWESYQEWVKGKLAKDSTAVLVAGAILEECAELGMGYLQAPTEFATFSKVVEELGDALFYLTALAHLKEVNLIDQSIESWERMNEHRLKELDFNLIYSVHEAILILIGKGGEIFSMIKKTTLHGHEWDVMKFINLLDEFTVITFHVARLFGTNLEMVLEENIKKLDIRYPNGFTQQDSINRSDLIFPI